MTWHKAFHAQSLTRCFSLKSNLCFKPHFLQNQNILLSTLYFQQQHSNLRLYSTSNFVIWWEFSRHAVSHSSCIWKVKLDVNRQFRDYQMSVSYSNTVSIFKCILGVWLLCRINSITLRIFWANSKGLPGALVTKMIGILFLSVT